MPSGSALQAEFGLHDHFPYVGWKTARLNPADPKFNQGELCTLGMCSYNRRFLENLTLYEYSRGMNADGFFSTHDSISKRCKSVSV